MSDVQKTNEALDGGEMKTGLVESRPFDEQTKLEIAIAGAEGQFDTAVNDATNLEQEVEKDVTLSETDRQELLVKIKSIKSGIQARWRIFCKKIKAAGHDFFRKAGEPWFDDRLWKESQAKPVTFESLRENLTAVSTRLQYIEKERMFDVSSYKEEETKAAWLSAWGHLLQAGRDFETLSVKNEVAANKLKNEIIESIKAFWEIILRKKISEEILNPTSAIL